MSSLTVTFCQNVLVESDSKWRDKNLWREGSISINFLVLQALHTVLTELQNKPIVTVQMLYEGVSKSFRTDRLEREQQMIELSATGCSCIAIL
jgi:hypothetical protein